MRITCPFCGQRDLAEYSYHGDAESNADRPAETSSDQLPWNTHIYDRKNPAGRHNELWQHSGGCRSFLTVTRDTRTHDIAAVKIMESNA